MVRGDIHTDMFNDSVLFYFLIMILISLLSTMASHGDYSMFKVTEMLWLGQINHGKSKVRVKQQKTWRKSGKDKNCKSVSCMSVEHATPQPPHLYFLPCLIKGTLHPGTEY